MKVNLVSQYALRQARFKLRGLGVSLRADADQKTTAEAVAKHYGNPEPRSFEAQAQLIHNSNKDEHVRPHGVLPEMKPLKLDVRMTEALEKAREWCVNGRSHS